MEPVKCTCNFSIDAPCAIHDHLSEKDEARGSRMPDRLFSIDPIFTDAAFRPFTPEQEAMVKEKTRDRRTA